MASSQLVALIKTLSPSRICLQFPDDLLHLSPTISASLTQYASVHILGDTTYGSCCVDTIAANHVSPDLLVHYGPACLSKPACVFPVYYEFEHLPIEYAQITGLIGNIEGRVMVFFNTLYNNAMEGVRQQMKQQDQEMYERIIWTEIDTLVNAHTLRDRTGYDSFHGRYFKMPSGGPDAVLYIGKPNLFSAHVAMQYAHCRVEMHDPETGGYATPSGNKMLMRRYALVQRAKDAMTIGIVIGTLGVGKSHCK